MSFAENGFEMCQGFLDEKIIESIITEINASEFCKDQHGVRNADKKIASVKKLVESGYLLEKAASYLDSMPQIVRVIIFDKTPSKNWLVTWHQDKTICVNEKKDIAGWGPWTLKEEVNHVQPGLEVLKRMVTLRIHLDDTNEENGCLKVIPGSHKLGILDQYQQEDFIQNKKHYLCLAKAGDLLVMQPLLLHSSGKGTLPQHRRIIHIEYSDFPLPQGMKWI
jgi:hypothetical protein